MRNTRLNKLTAAVLLSGVSSVAIAGQGLRIGPFLDVSLGASGIGFKNIGLAEQGDTKHRGTVGKVSAGYWFSKHWGVSANYVDLGRLEQRFDGELYNGRAKSYGASLLGRVGLGERWTFIGKINLVRSEIRRIDNDPGNSAIRDYYGRESSVVLPGLELHYRFNDQGSMFLDIDPRGKGASKAALGYVGVGVRWAF